MEIIFLSPINTRVYPAVVDNSNVEWYKTFHFVNSSILV